MPKTYNLSTSFRTPKPRSKKLRGLANTSTTTNIAGTTDGSLMAKLREMFILVDANGNEVESVEDAVAVKVANGLSLLSEGEITAYAPTQTP